MTLQVRLVAPGQQDDPEAVFSDWMLDPLWRVASQLEPAARDPLREVLARTVARLASSPIVLVRDGVPVARVHAREAAIELQAGAWIDGESALVFFLDEALDPSWDALPWRDRAPGEAFYLVYLDTAADPRSRASCDPDLGRDPDDLWSALDEANARGAPVTRAEDGHSTTTVTLR